MVRPVKRMPMGCWERSRSLLFSCMLPLVVSSASLEPAATRISSVSPPDIGVLVAVGGSGVLVGVLVAVGGSGVLVGVSVGPGNGVAVAVAVGVGGTGVLVAVGGAGVLVGDPPLVVYATCKSGAALLFWS